VIRNLFNEEGSLGQNLNKKQKEFNFKFQRLNSYLNLKNPGSSHIPYTDCQWAESVYN
jgi:hypothetical protein